MDQYREGKVKRTVSNGVKKNLKPCACKLSEPIRVTACLLHNEPTSCSSLARFSALRRAAGAKASPNRAYESVEADAKLCDLPMVRLKVG